MIIGIVITVVLVLALFFITIAPVIFDALANTVVKKGPHRVFAAAAEQHASLLVADLHCDALLWNRDLLERHGWGHVDLPRLIEGNVALQSFTVATKVPFVANYGSNADDADAVTVLSISQRRPWRTWTSLLERALYQARTLHDAAQRSGGKLRIITSAKELDDFIEQRRRQPGLVAGFLGIEGLHSLEGKIENVDVLFNAGFRMMAPVHFFDNEVGGSAHGTKKTGLTDFGRQVLDRMDERHILLDMAHASPALLDDVLAAATHPVVISHTGVKGTCPGARNISDDHIRGIAATGGVIGIGFWKLATGGRDAASIVRAIRYTADLAGADHVGLGSDFDGTVKAAFDTTGLPLITEELMREGFASDEVRKIMGGNIVRVLRETLP